MKNTRQEFHPGILIETFQIWFFSSMWRILPTLLFILFLSASVFQNTAHSKENVSNKEFCFKITPIKNNILDVRKAKLGCFKKNEPPPKTKSYCKNENWYSVSIGIHECLNSKGYGYRLERKYPI